MGLKKEHRALMGLLNILDGTLKWNNTIGFKSYTPHPQSHQQREIGWECVKIEFLGHRPPPTPHPLWLSNSKFLSVTFYFPHALLLVKNYSKSLTAGSYTSQYDIYNPALLMKTRFIAREMLFLESTNLLDRLCI